MKITKKSKQKQGRKNATLTWREASILSKVFHTTPSNIVSIVRNQRKAEKSNTQEYYKTIRDAARRLRAARIENEEALSDHYADIIEEIKQK